MGMSYDHQVTMVVSEDETTYLEQLEDRLPAGHFYNIETPVYGKSQKGNRITFSSGGYGTFELTELPLPNSLIGLVHTISSCQGDEVDMLDMLEKSDFEEEWFVESDYSNPFSEYWVEDNPQFNLYHETPSYEDLMEDEEELDEELDVYEVYDERLEKVMEKRKEDQNKEKENLLTMLEGRVAVQ